MKRCHPLIAVLILGVALSAGCSEDDEGTPTGPALSVTVSATPAAPATGATVTLTATVDPSGTGYEYRWTVEDGTLRDADKASATWIVPDADGNYSVQVVVNDGSDAAIGKASIVVSDYAPPVSPFYVGAQTCATCHSTIHGRWRESGHAGALETLAEIGQGGNARCLECHTVGYDTAVANGGFDEQQVARLGNVGCESCHAPGSAHPNQVGALPIDSTAVLCGGCHEGEHHPTYAEWQASPHGKPVIASPGMRGGSSQCAKCHNGVWAIEYLNDPLNFTRTDTPTDSMRIVCVVCHDPHGNGNPGQLRNAIHDVALPDGLHPDAGAGRLCIACHNGRRTATNIEGMIQNGSGHFGPHHSNQGDMLAGTGAYENVNPSFHFASSKHIQIKDGCINCHTHHIESELPYYTGHEFKPVVEACQPCHGAIAGFAEVLAKDDYDGDGTVEGVQDEVTGLVHVLEDAIVASARDDGRRSALEAALAGGTFSVAVGDTSITSIAQRKAGYNLFFVEFDHSKGVHNATYAIQLLQQSILSLSPPLLANARILVE